MPRNRKNPDLFFWKNFKLQNAQKKIVFRVSLSFNNNLFLSFFDKNNPVLVNMINSLMYLFAGKSENQNLISILEDDYRFCNICTFKKGNELHIKL